MKKNMVILFFLAVFGLVFSGMAMAIPLGDNITIWDGMGVVDVEDNEVAPGCVASQVWDLEGFFLDGNMLTMVGGFNYVTGQISLLISMVMRSTDQQMTVMATTIALLIIPLVMSMCLILTLEH